MNVRTTTARCDHCGFLREGELLHGSTCDRCEAGRFVNVAKIAADETPEPWEDAHGQA